MAESTPGKPRNHATGAARFAVCLLALTAVVAPHARAEDDKSRVAPLDIRVAEDGWGDVRPRTVEKHLQSVARELWRYFPGRELPAIRVQPRGGPIVLFRRGDDGEITVRLNTGDAYWAQYAYQFAHEFCHILCNYDPDPHGHDWFEESLCELASLFVLRKMGETWKTDPPFEHWKSYAPHLTEYAAKRIEKQALPEGQTLAEWFEQNQDELYKSATNWPLNGKVAVALLPLFERKPEHWEAVTWLNHGKPEGRQTFAAYLADWRRHAPERHHAFIDEITAAFGVESARPEDGCHLDRMSHSGERSRSFGTPPESGP